MGWMAMEAITPEPAMSRFASTCRARSYILTEFCVATKRKGLAGWNRTLVTRPRFLRKGFCEAPLLS